MVIAVENGLEKIKKYLTERGFSVVDLNGVEIYDAAVYQNLGIFNIPVPVRVTAKAEREQAGTFLVCARGKTPQEVETILRQKAYGNLF